MSYVRKGVTRRQEQPVNERKIRNAIRHAEIWEAFRRGEITFTMDTAEGVRIIRTEQEIREIYHLSPEPARQVSESTA